MTTTLGVDVARYGTDRTAIAIQTDGYLHALHTITKGDLVTQAHQITTLAAQYPNLAAINVDDTGVGGGLTDILKAEHGPMVRAVNYGAKPHQPHSLHYVNTATALWFIFRDKLQNATISISPDLPHLTELTRELTSQEWDFADGGSKLKIKSKGEVKAELGRSPDLADAVLLAFWDAPALTPEFYDVGV